MKTLFLSFLLISVSITSITAQNSFDSLYAVIEAQWPDEKAPHELAIKNLASRIYSQTALVQEQSLLLANFYSDKDNVKKASAQRLYALTYYVQEDYNTALQILIPLVDIMKNSGSKTNLASIYESLSLTYKLRGDLETVFEYGERALRLYQQDGNYLNAASCANNLAINYMAQANYSDAKKYYNIAIDYYRENNLSGQLAMALINSGSLNVLEGNNNRARDELLESLKLMRGSKNDLALAYAYTSLGNAELNLSNRDIAEKYLEEGYNLALVAGSFQQTSIASELLARAYAESGDHEQAYLFQRKWFVLQDSFRTAEADERLVKTLQEFENEKKENEIAMLSSKNKIAKQNMIVSLLGAGALGIFAVLIYNNRNKVQAMNDVLEVQKGEISKNLKEKEFLLKEIHHRVKNNLQVISSLLRLQSKKTSNKEAKKALDDGRTRVRSMSLIHQNLYQKDNLSGINMDNYIHQLTNEIIETYHLNNFSIDCDIEVAPIILDVETVVPIGLIINEMVNNSIKHAFDSGTRGNILVKLYEEDDKLILMVSDNGIGFDTSATKNDSFGISLIEAFADRLSAEYTIDSVNGTKTTFSITNYKKAG